MFEKIKQKLLGFLVQGSSPKSLALALSLSILVGVIPLLGTTTILCGAIAYLFKLNMPAMQSVNYLIYPVQLLLFIPFLKLGAFISGTTFDYSLTEISTMVFERPWETIQEIFGINVLAVLVWLGMSLVLFPALYFIWLKFFKGLERILHKG